MYAAVDNTTNKDFIGRKLQISKLLIDEIVHIY